MNQSSPTPLYLNENPVAVPIPRAFQQAYLWSLGAIGGLALAALFIFAVATQSEADAERIVGAQSVPQTPAAGLVQALAAMHGRPGAL